jgi:hypothetical protein
VSVESREGKLKNGAGLAPKIRMNEMRNCAIRVAVAALACFVVAACLAEGAALPEPKTVTVKGVVAVTWDDNWNPAAVTVKDTTKRPAVVYQVALDAKGIDLANEMEDAEVEIVAVLTEDQAEKTKTLKVKSFKAVKAEKPEDVPEEEGAAAQPEPEPEDEGEW